MGGRVNGSLGRWWRGETCAVEAEEGGDWGDGGGFDNPYVSVDIPLCPLVPSLPAAASTASPAATAAAATPPAAATAARATIGAVSAGCEPAVEHLHRVDGVHAERGS